MKKLLVALSILLSGCASMIGAKVSYKAETENYKMTIFEMKCSDAKVLETFRDLGAPQEVMDTLKQGQIEIKVGPRQGIKIAVCATEAGPLGTFEGKLFIADAEGSAGYLTIKEPKPMKEDHPGPNQKGT